MKKIGNLVNGRGDNLGPGFQIRLKWYFTEEESRWVAYVNDRNNGKKPKRARFATEKELRAYVKCRDLPEEWGDEYYEDWCELRRSLLV